MKALLLAAGYGTRLRPLTDFLPKPLCLFMGQPMLDLVYGQVERLAAVTGIAVNTHHLADVLALHIQSRQNVYSRPVHISHEPEILGTGGCLNPLRAWIDGDDLLIYNGDIISDLDLEAFQKRHAAERPIASMALLPYKPGTTPVFVRKGKVLSIGTAVEDAQKMTFSGIHILSARFIDRVPKEGFQNVIDTYKGFLAEGAPVLAFEHHEKGFWADLGTPQDYLKAHQDLWQHPHRDRIAKALGLRLKDFTWDPSTQSLYTFPVEALALACRNSFVFGPLPASTEIESCIVYPLTKLSRREERKVLTPQATLDIT